MKKKLYIKTYGCQMNVYDSKRMEDLLKCVGYEVSEEIEHSDMVILNTCNVREKAAEKVYSELGKIKSYKSEKQNNGENMIIAVAGCVSQAEGDEMFKRAPYIDIIVGPQTYHHLPDMIADIERKKGRKINLDFPVDEKFDKLPEEVSSQGVSAFLTVQEGCDKFCTFCSVPYTRGPEYSRSVSELYREAIKLVENGAKEITLLGQNVTAYNGVGPDGEVWDMGRLIKHIAKINGLERLRYTTSHPRDLNASLLAAHRDVEILMPFLHLPVQSGSNSILKAMNRKHTREQYFLTVKQLKDARPDLEFSSDFIVGFPGETDQDFEDTLDLVRQVNYIQAYSFKYSIRPGTPGGYMEEQVPEEVKSERLYRLQELLTKQQKDFNQSMIGKTVPVLFDKIGKYENQIIGKTPYLQSVNVSVNNKDLLMNQITNVKIEDASQNSLKGILLQEKIDA